MARIDSLLARVADQDLRADLTDAVAELQRTRDFGLVFESHLPETVRLPHHPIRRGVKVAFRDASDDAIHAVGRVAAGVATITPLRGDGADDEAPFEAPVDELVVVAEFGDPIYPGLRHLGSVRRGGSKPSHVVIKGENHHVLEALQFTHAGKVDAIYIDPPYNTGAGDWSYNNDYVDDDDKYRHSKWLAFIERRLRLAKLLLRPEKSALIVTIDAREMVRLGMLLEQTFRGCPVQIATIVINPSGAGNEGLNRVDEYAFFVSIGGLLSPTADDDLLTDGDVPNPRIRGGLSWESFLRSGSTWYRAERANLCYPIVIDPESMRIVGTGKPFGGKDETRRAKTKGGLPVAWPVRRNGRLGIWRTDAATLEGLVDKGYAYVSSYDQTRGTWAIKYLLSGTIDLIESGEAPVTRTGERGQVVSAETSTIAKTAKSVWHRPAHNAGKHGSDLVQALVPGQRFPYPKSLYAVEDTLRLCVGDNPDAVILDFFGGSGTTAHAVARLNRADDGRRQSIVVTNNEVSYAKSRELRADGHRPGDTQWEADGIFERITRPRITASITGKTSTGKAVKGSYRYNGEFEIADGLNENVDFFALTYEDAGRIELGTAFDAIAPLLWMRAGGRGDVLSAPTRKSRRRQPYVIGEQYGVLFNPDAWRPFVDELPASATTVYVITDSSTTFAQVASELPHHITDRVRLYERYLTAFAINERSDD